MPGRGIRREACTDGLFWDNLSGRKVGNAEEGRLKPVHQLSASPRFKFVVKKNYGKQDAYPTRCRYVRKRQPSRSVCLLRKKVKNTEAQRTRRKKKPAGAGARILCVSAFQSPSSRTMASRMLTPHLAAAALQLAHKRRSPRNVCWQLPTPSLANHSARFFVSTVAPPIGSTAVKYVEKQTLSL